MKKTIIITVAMLCVFGAVVMFGASRVSTDWQQPSEDDVEISSTSPVEQVEKTINTYEYSIGITGAEDFPYEDGMLTYGEAVNYGSIAIDNIFIEFPTDEYIFKVERTYTLDNRKAYEMWCENFSQFNTDKNFVVGCMVDAYTGQIISIDKKGIFKNQNMKGKMQAIIENDFLKYALQTAEDIGCAEIKQYAIKTYGEMELIVAIFPLKDETIVVCMDYEYDNKYKTDNIDFRVNVYKNEYLKEIYQYRYDIEKYIEENAIDIPYEYLNEV